MSEQGKIQTIIVVDIYNSPCICHQVIIGRLIDNPHRQREWVLLFARKPLFVEFGDYIEGNFEDAFEDIRAYLLRNDKLRFRVFLDRMPAELGVPMLQQLPYGELYGDEYRIEIDTD